MWWFVEIETFDTANTVVCNARPVNAPVIRTDLPTRSGDNVHIWPPIGSVKVCAGSDIERITPAIPPHSSCMGEMLGS